VTANRERDRLREAMAQPAVARIAEQLRTRVPVEARALAETRLAAVVSVLRVVEGTAELLFIKRSEREGDPWSGHMAFPGGRHEPEDTSLEATARRETFEELALDLSRGRVLGRLDDLAPRNAALPPILIRPFVAVVPADVIFSPSEEVAATFWVPLTVLRHEDTRAEHVITINGARSRFPGFRVEQHIVWGLTERIVQQLLSLLDP
jgi:8-oxo-dGTP pyrophosphatase MutT (NUDIX family)